MSIPTYDQLIFPLLKVLAAHQDGIKTRAAYDAVADAAGLTEDDRRELLPSGKQPVYQNRIGWANDRLKRAGLSRSIARGTWQLTDKGQDFVVKHPNGLDDETRRGLTDVPTGSTASQAGVTPQSAAAMEVQSPDERIDTAARELQESLSADLLDAITNMPPVGFEGLVLDVLHAMGYGTSQGDLQQTPASGDGGIDGIITLDRLGLEKVYVQAKRWTTGTVGRPEIQKFVGALAGQGGTRGVFITTSTFSKEAREYAERVPSSLVLIDGDQLALLMIEYGVGVSAQRVVKIARIDTDYFEEG